VALDRRRRHRFRRGRIPAAQRHQPEPGPGQVLRRMGRGHHVRQRGGLTAGADRTSPEQAGAAAAQGQQGRRRTGQDHRLDSPHLAQAPRKVEMIPGVRYRKHRRRRAAHHRRRARSRDRRRHHRRDLRRPGAAARTAGRAAGGRIAGAPDRRCRRGGRTRRQTRHRARLRAGRGAAIASRPSHDRPSRHHHETRLRRQHQP
jgi:hypothetical protein